MIFIYVFYIDLFLEQNFLMNLIVLSLTFLLCKCQVSLRYLRMGLASLCGALAAALLLLFGPGYGWAVAGQAFFVVPAMLLISFGWNGKKDFLIRMGISWFSIVVLNGVASAIQNLTGLKRLTFYTAIAVLGVCRILLELLQNSVRRQGRLWNVTLYRGKCMVKCLGLYDSGNLLTIPDTGEAVHIVSPNLIEQLGMKEEGSLRLIPYQALGTASGWIRVVQVERMELQSGKKCCILSNVWLGKAEEELLKGKSYQMILNGSVERSLS